MHRDKSSSWVRQDVNKIKSFFREQEIGLTVSYGKNIVPSRFFFLWLFRRKFSKFYFDSIIEKLTSNAQQVLVLSQVAQAHYESPEQHYPTQLINYSYSKKIIIHCMGKCSLLTKLAKCTLNIALKLTFSVFLFFFEF